jgi:ATP-dependent DNA ligase
MVAKAIDKKFVKPMLVSEIPGHRDRIMDQPYVFIQPKLDGWCCMANARTKKIYTRSGREITNLPHVTAWLPNDGPEWLHGELYAHGYTLEEIGAMIHAGSNIIELHVFDAACEGDFSKRWSKVPTFSCHATIRLVVPIVTRPPHIKTHYKEFLSNGYEGIIIRLDGHTYEHKRSVNVFKMKPGLEGV